MRKTYMNLSNDRNLGLMGQTARLVRRDRRKTYANAAHAASESTLDRKSAASLKSDDEVDMTETSNPTRETPPDRTPTPGSTQTFPKALLAQQSNPSQEVLTGAVNRTVPEAPQELQESIEKERQFREEVELRLQQKECELEVSQNQLRETAKELEEVRKQWRLAAADLNKIRTLGQGFYQVTDGYLIDLIVQLRHLIRDFAIQYFGDRAPSTATIIRTEYFKRYLRRVNPKAMEGSFYLDSPKNHSKVVQAFLWRLLVGEVFSGFHWTGRHFSRRIIMPLWNLLKPEHYASPETALKPDPEAERNFQMWSARTTKLFMSAVDFGKDPGIRKEIQQRKSGMVSLISTTIDQCSRPDKKGFPEQLHAILDAAYNLDKEISRQVARIVWVFNYDSPVQIKFDPLRMEMEAGDRILERNEDVHFVVAPAVIKRGKSTGEDFESENLLVKMVVCEE